MRSRILLASALAVLLLAGGAAARTGEAGDRPRIGLCLAGGGARGGAHIGVLRVLEELRVPVDCIAGTSIGSIIGGLYASGYSPADMDSAVLSIDWTDLFDDAPPRPTVNFRRKEEDRLPYFKFEFGFGRGGIKVPAGLIAGQKLNLLLHRLTLHTALVDDFDDLPIPFRAVATDLDAGVEVILDHGPLADAMRGSMAIPGAFTPHEVGGRLLVDGGIVRNVPVDVVAAMGADVIIVVDVGMPPRELDADASIIGVLMQTVNVGIHVNAGASIAGLRDGDVLVTPDLDGINTESFTLMDQAADRGEAAARLVADRLGRFSLPEAEYEAWRAGQRSDLRMPAIMIADVRVPAPSRVDPRRIDRRIHSQPHEPLDVTVLENDLARIYRIGDFETVDYQLAPAAGMNARDLVVRTRDKRWGPNYLRLGLYMAGNLDGDARFTALVYHRRATINSLGAEWRNQVFLGNLLGLTSEFYQPLDMRGRFFVAPRATGLMNKQQRYLSFDVSEQISSRRLVANLDVGLNMSHWGELRLGVLRGEFWGSADDQPDALDLDDQLGGLTGRLAFDQLDDLDFPRHGWSLTVAGDLSRSGLGASSDYERLWSSVRAAVTTGRVSFLGHVEAGTSFGAVLPFHDRFELGGLGHLSGVQRGRVFGDDAGYAGVGLLYRLATLDPPLGGNVFLGVAAEAGQAWAAAAEPGVSDLRKGGAVYLGAETLFGPVNVGYGWLEGGHDTAYVIVGRVI